MATARAVIRAWLLAIVCAAASALALSGEASAQSSGFLLRCGTVRSYVPLSGRSEGTLSIGSSSYKVIGGPEVVRFEVGADMCVAGSLSRGDLFISHLNPSAPMPAHLCGYAESFQPASATAAGSTSFDSFTPSDPSRQSGVVTLAIPAGTDLGPEPAGTNRRCFAVTVDRATGDAMAVRRVDHFAVEGFEQVNLCGRVKDYRPATASTPGLLVLGTRSYPIVAGFVYRGDPAGDRQDRTASGKEMCVSGRINGRGELLDFIAGDFYRKVGGVVMGYVPATATERGFLALGHTVQLRYAVEPGVRLGLHGRPESVCIEAEVNAEGDPIASRRVACEQGGIGRSVPGTPLPVGPCSAIPTVVESAAHADVVVHGTVTSDRAGQIGFVVDRVLKGRIGSPQIAVSVPVGPTAYAAAAGSDHVLYLRGSAGSYRTDACDTDHPGPPTAEEQALLPGGEMPTVASASPTATPVSPVSGDPGRDGLPLVAVGVAASLALAVAFLFIRWRRSS